MKARTNVISKSMIAIFLFALTSLMQAAESIEPKKGLWERFCLEQSILDACSKAVRSLKVRINGELDLNIRTQLQLRLSQVHQKACTLASKKHQAASARLINIDVCKR